MYGLRGRCQAPNSQATTLFPQPYLSLGSVGTEFGSPEPGAGLLSCVSTPFLGLPPHYSSPIQDYEHFEGAETGSSRKVSPFVKALVSHLEHTLAGQVASL